MNATRMTSKSLTAPGRMNWLRATHLVPTLMLVLTLGASVCANTPAYAARATSEPRTQPAQPEFGEMNGHVFLYSAQGTSDVTTTLRRTNNQTYATFNGQTIAININTTNGYVYDMNGNVIGYVMQPSE